MALILNQKNYVDLYDGDEIEYDLELKWALILLKKDKNIFFENSKN